ncbi:hypothetical protein [Rudaea cellulosilytica]|nr:hypothetical protein [Rudaea cellulosilytica]
MKPHADPLFSKHQTDKRMSKNILSQIAIPDGEFLHLHGPLKKIR